MKNMIPVLLVTASLVVMSGTALAERNQDSQLASEYRNIQHNSQLFDVLQHYYFTSRETADAMQSSMNTRQLDKITQQLELMNKNLNALITLEKQCRVASPLIKKG